jgi:hypothetical protein
MKSEPTTADHPRLNPWRLEPVDLRRFMRLGVTHIYEGCIDRRCGCLPFVRFNLTNPPTLTNHEYWGSPHMVGRFLDALALCSEVIDVPVDDVAIDGLRKLLHDSLNNPTGLPFDTRPDPKGRRSANMHNCREALLSLVGLAKWRGCERSLTLARQLVRAMDRETRRTGAYPSYIRFEGDWGRPDEDGWNNWANYTTGRAITALVTCYRLTHDDLALELARRFADDNIRRTMTPDGHLTETGPHLHSTEGTVAGLLYLGEVTGEKRYLEGGRRVYDVGLKPWRTSYGWAKETRTPGKGRGEANNTGDLIEAALVLARNGYPQYYGDAERFVRNALLASQIVNTDWIPQSDKPDAPDDVYSDIRKRARGGFAFTMPNGYDSYNTDLVGGALRGLYHAHKSIVTCRDGACRINLLFSTETPWLAVRSSLPHEQRVDIQVHKRCTLTLRLPEGVAAQDVDLRVADRPRPANLIGSDLAVGDVDPDTAVSVRMRVAHWRTREAPPGLSDPRDIDWLGDTIVAMRPAEGPIALY